MYYQTPVELFTNDFYNNMSIQAKMTYGILLDRQKNYGFVDEKGKKYCYFVQAELRRLLNCHMSSLKRYLRELIDFNLLEYNRKEFNKPNRIYLKEIGGDDLLIK